MDDVQRTADALESLRRQFHPKKDDSVTVPLELLEKAEATKRIFNLVLGLIAGISPIVGGIGIITIMLATVLERTRAIGIRRALGARRRDIVAQFLIETSVISASGGLIGVLLGVSVPPLVSRLSGIPAVIRSKANGESDRSSPMLSGLIVGACWAKALIRIDHVGSTRMGRSFLILVAFVLTSCFLPASDRGSWRK
jgi:ABC-type antimicrobial peptide transport system permease subunit